MPEVLTEHKPPDTGTVKFCAGCGRNDRFTVLRERHFAGGEICTGEIVTLEYALVDPERARLERLVIKAAKKWYAQAIEHDFDLYPEERGMADVVKILIEFESQQIKK